MSNDNNNLAFVHEEWVLEVRKTYRGPFCPENMRLVITCSEGDDDESHRDVRLVLVPDQQEKLQAWLVSNESLKLTLTDDDCTLTLLRCATGLDVECLDSQTWIPKPTKIEIKMTLDLEEVENLTQWLAQPFELRN